MSSSTTKIVKIKKIRDDFFGKLQVLKVKKNSLILAFSKKLDNKQIDKELSNLKRDQK